MQVGGYVKERGTIMEKENKEDLGDLLDMLDHCTQKIGFIAEFFTKGDPGYNFEISERGYRRSLLCP